MKTICSIFPIERWGKDHWSTFAYIETRVVDYKGKLDSRHMRDDGDSYPTITKGSNQQGRDEVLGHNDWDCVADMLALGLIDLKGEIPDKLINGRVIHRLVHQNKIRVKLTKYGQNVAGALRAHKGDGGNFQTFLL